MELLKPSRIRKLLSWLGAKAVINDRYARLHIVELGLPKQLR